MSRQPTPFTLLNPLSTEGVIKVTILPQPPSFNSAWRPAGRQDNAAHQKLPRVATHDCVEFVRLFVTSNWFSGSNICGYICNSFKLYLTVHSWFQASIIHSLFHSFFIISIIINIANILIVINVIITQRQRLNNSAINIIYRCKIEMYFLQIFLYSNSYRCVIIEINSFTSEILFTQPVY